MTAIPTPTSTNRFQAFDLLATPIAVLNSSGLVVFVNSELEDVMGQSRRSLDGQSFLQFFSDPQPLLHALTGAKANEFAALRYDAELLRINPELYETAMSQLKANLDNARAALAGAEAQSIKAKSSFDQAGLNYKRQKKLYDQKVISDQEWENAQLQYEVAKADFEAAGKSVLGSKYNVQSVAARLEEGKRNLGRTSIYAPASGIVTHLTSEKGERVVGTAQMAGTEIMRISNMHMMEVQVNVNENDIVRIHRGDSADVKVDAYDGRIFRGVVTEIANSAVFNAAQNMSDQVTNFVVKIRLVPSSYQDLTAEGEFPFLPGMTASVDVKTKTKTGVVSVPIAAVTTRNPMGASKDGKAAESKSDVQTWVFLYNGGKAKAVEVKTGVQDLDFYEVLGGLKVGDEVVSGPSMSVAKTLNDGDKLKKKK